MELKQLRYFVAVAEELHFQRAARRLHITQPALSHQIKVLENELELTLLERDRKSVKLSKAGEVFLAEVKDILRILDNAVTKTQAAAGLETKALTIGTRFFINLPLFTTSVVNLKRTHPHIEVTQIDMPTNEVEHAVKEGEIDIGFAPPPIEHPALITKRIIEGYFVVVMPKEHSLAQDKEVPITALQDQPLIFFDKALNPRLYQTCVGHFENAGFSPKIVMETGQVASGIRMVGEGLGFFFLANYVVADLPDHLVAQRISGFDNRISILAVWHENNKSAALKAYLEELRR